ncbi:MAG: ABC-F family ATP-binding cassette domain-containing protein, partial [Spirochaetales bacterium]|nr:ABC-F family ATP-binding cassette domain-containing protein [Spirochaetales bacterium]
QLDRLLIDYQNARDEYDAMDGDEAAVRSEKLLESFGLSGKIHQAVSTLSGGERNILSLAQASLSRPDLLILDEPGNHLDYIGLAWLEEFLRSFAGAVLLVSHNRYLLDRVANQILELENGKITEYSGNYSHYRRSKLQQLVATQADYTANQKRLAQLEALVKRFEEIARRTADPAWGKRLRARRTQLGKEREQAVEKPELDTRSMAVELSRGNTKADIALQINSYSKKFGENIILDSADLQFSCGERVALIGPNGSGKTTLLKDIVSKASWDDKILRVGPSLTIGYCAQNQEVFNPENTMLEEFIDLGTQNRKNTYALLSKFLFKWEEIDKKIRSLSGGEMNRLQLARLVILGANFLILDEPTNHLDIGSREAIEESLEEFQGTLLVVSHDRYFLDKIADRIVEIRDKKLKIFDGNFSEFFTSRTKNRTDAKKTRNLNQQKQAGRDQNTSAGQTQQKILEALEQRIEILENEKIKLERQITVFFEAGDHKKGREQSNKLEKVSTQLEKLYGDWENLGV